MNKPLLFIAALMSAADYKESKERGDVIRAAKASIRSEIFWEIILFINKLDIEEARNQ